MIATTSFVAATHPTPAGPYSFILGPDGICAGGFTDDIERTVGLLGPKRAAEAATLGVSRVTDAGIASKAVLAWADGDMEPMQEVGLDLEGTAFQQEVWAALCGIPAGGPFTYRRLAEAAGRPTAVRAAGHGCATNRVSLFVPCHRVVPAAGGVGGFLWGPEVKRAALAHEASAVAAAPD